MTLNLDDLERVVNLSGAHVKDHLVWPRAEIAALIAKLREAEAVIAEALELIATVKAAGEVPVDVFAIERILARSKPTNQEGES